MCVKCREDGELPTGRKKFHDDHTFIVIGICCGTYVASRCIRRFVSYLLLRSGSAKEVFFMKKLLALISESYHEFKNISTITCCAMFGAMAIVLGSFASINVTPNLKIGFGSLPNELVDYLFGPVVGALFGGGMDLVKFMIKPDGGFMPGFTLNAMLAAFIYGMFLYKRPLSLPRMLAAKLVVAVLVNTILGTYWLSLLNGKGYLVILPARAIKNLIQWPVDSIIFYTVAKTLEKANVFQLIKRTKR